MSERIALFVVGAHLTGMPLNRELTEVKAELRGPVTTAADYRLFVLPNTTPPKPGLIRAPGSLGPGIAGEVWLLDPADFGRFVARIPAPLGIGKVTLSDGESVSGFLCEAFATKEAEEITELGGWQAYLAEQKARQQT
jgi:allophanate hydrolase